MGKLLGIALLLAGCDTSHAAYDASWEATDQGGRLVTSHAAVLPLSEGEAALHPCTRTTPRSSGSYWVPSDSLVTAVDSMLPRYLRAALWRDARQHGYVPLRADTYYRQYIGFMDGRERLVYITGAGEFYFRRETGTERRRLLTDRVISACDGGIGFFGIQYNPRTRKLGRVHFNGRV